MDRPEVSAEIGLSPASDQVGPGGAIFVFGTLKGLYGALDRIYRLGVSLPDAPLKAFRATSDDLPRTTEAERLVVQRVGQDVFRQALLAYWGGRCRSPGSPTSNCFERLTSSHGPNAKPTKSGSMFTMDYCYQPFGTLRSMPVSSVLPMMA